MNRAFVTFLLLLVAFAFGCRKDEQRSQAVASASAPRTEAQVPEVPIASAAPPALAPQWKRPLLFKVTTRGKHFHVFGTIHLPDSRLDDFPPALEAAFEESAVVFTEMPLDDAAQAAVAPAVKLPDGQTLAAIVPPQLYERVAGAFREQGVPMTAVDGLKPWAVSVQLTLLDRMITLALKKPLDAVLWRRATKSGKEAGGLETPQEQLSVFDSLTRKEQIELLRQSVDLRDRMKKEKRDLLEEILVAYIEGADQRLLDLMQEGYDEKDPLTAKLMKRLFTDRNKLMTERIVAKVGAKPEKVHFFAVGAGHLVGGDGIVARLRQRGFEVTRTVP